MRGWLSMNSRRFGKTREVPVGSMLFHQASLPPRLQVFHPDRHLFLDALLAGGSALAPRLSESSERNRSHGKNKSLRTSIC